MLAQAVRQRKAFSGLRPVNPSHDMAQIADLMEEAFGDDLTPQSREALREMRMMSYFGPFLWLLDRISPGFHETFQGFAWEEEGRVVGNVSVGRVAPHSLRWLISNVAVRPDYQGQGIAHHLVQAAIELAREYHGKWIILQVHTDNVRARKLYRNLGFEQFAAETKLRLEKATPVLDPSAAPEHRSGQGHVLRKRSYGEWRKEYALALAATSREAQWLMPVRPGHFMVGLDQRLFKQLSNLMAGRKEYRLAVEDGERFLATLTVLASRWRGEHSLELMVHPDHRGQLEEMLIAEALRILGNYPERGVVVSHPGEHQEAIEALKRHGFTEERTLAQMRLALRKTQRTNTDSTD
jgi:ribosomal protein S18 acetylase RimI-like enzyme